MITLFMEVNVFVARFEAWARVSYGLIAGILVFAYFIYHSVEGD